MPVGLGSLARAARSSKREAEKKETPVAVRKATKPTGPAVRKVAVKKVDPAQRPAVKKKAAKKPAAPNHKMHQ